MPKDRFEASGRDVTESTPSEISVYRHAVRRFASATGVLLLAFVGVPAFIYSQERMHELALIRQQTQRVLDLKIDILSREFRWVQSDLLYLAGQELLQQLSVDPEPAIPVLQDEFVRLAEQKGVYDQIRYLNANGKEVVRVNYARDKSTVVPEDELQTKANRYYYQEALKLPASSVFVSPFDLNVEHGQIERPLKPVIRFIAPVDNKDRGRLGLVAINYLGGSLLDLLVDVPAGMRGRFLVVNGTGEYIRGPVSDAAWGWMLGHHRTFKREFAIPWNRFTNADDQQCLVDAGLFTFRRFSLATSTESTGQISEFPITPGGQRSPVASSRELILVSHVPKDVLFAASRALLQKLILISIMASLAILGLAWYWAYAGAVRSAQGQRLAASEARLRALSRELLTSQEDERRRISRELHDNLKQQVTALRVNLRMAASQLDHPLPLYLQRAEKTVDSLLTDLQELATRLRMSLLDDLGLEQALQEYLHSMQSTSTTKYVCTMAFGDVPLSPVVAENMFRIVQEATTNIEKHAAAAVATIDIRCAEDAVNLTLHDDGRGFELNRSDASRLGILGMRERAELLGGSFEIHSAPLAGTRIRVTLPISLDD